MSVNGKDSFRFACHQQATAIIRHRQGDARHAGGLHYENNKISPNVSSKVIIVVFL